MDAIRKLRLYPGSYDAIEAGVAEIEKLRAALKRAVFYLESPVAPPEFNATGAVDEIRAALTK